jgi:fatty-acyl-CoA synthase
VRVLADSPHALPAAVWQAAAAAHGERTALISQEGRAISYEELDRAANALANALLERGLQRGDVLATLLPNSPALVQCYLATSRCGVVMLPLSTRLTAYELAAQVHDATPAAMLYDAGREALLREALPQLPPLFVAHGDDEALIDPGTISSGAAETAPGVTIDPADPFCVMYSGGTSGVPKGVIQTHGAWARCIENVSARWQLVAEDIHIVAFPMTHVAWFTCASLLSVGGTSVIWRDWSPARVLDTVQQRSVTTLNTAPTMLGDLLDELDRSARDLSSLRLYTLPGAPLPAEVYARARGWFGDILGNIYGMTESSGPITFLMPDEMAGGRPLSAGRAAEGVELWLLDDERRQVATGEEGEVCLAGVQITSGYLNAPPEHAESIRDGVLHTGDVGRLDEEGYLYIVGRKKEMIKSGGYNVYPREVEDVLLSHPDVLEAAVFGVPDPRWIEAVNAVVVPCEGATVDPQAVIEHCRTYLSRYKVPKRIHVSERLPRTVVGKVDKLSLEASYGARDAAGGDAGGAGDGESARSGAVA